MSKNAIYAYKESLLSTPGVFLTETWAGERSWRHRGIIVGTLWLIRARLVARRGLANESGKGVPGGPRGDKQPDLQQAHDRELTLAHQPCARSTYPMTWHYSDRGAFG
jgi:hypothetical protein